MIVISLIFIFNAAFAHTDGSLDTQTNRNSKIKRAIYLIKRGGSTEDKKIDYQNAIVLLKQEIDLNNCVAMNCLGNVYKQGIGVKKDNDEALKWYMKAAAANSPEAMYNLGVTYKYGDGVERNLKESSSWFKIGAEQGHAGCMYAIGYMYYKGFGVRQNYKKAYKYFSQSAKGENPAGTYFKALCIFKGNGVKQNRKEAKKIFEIAVLQGSSRAVKFLSHLTKQESMPLMASSRRGKTKSKELPSKNIPDVMMPSKFEYVIPTWETIGLDGEWIGKMRLYDWSGKKIESEHQFEVDFQANGSRGKWTMNKGADFKFKANNIENTLHFDSLHYEDSKLPAYDIKNIELELTSEEDENYIVGNALFYSNRKIEEGRPVYIVLKKKQNSIPEANEVAYETPSKEVLNYQLNFNATPNPFKNHFDIEFSIEKEGDIRLELIDVRGKIVALIYAGSLSEGVYRESFNGNLSSGVYLLRLVYNETVQCKKMIRQ